MKCDVMETYEVVHDAMPASKSLNSAGLLSRHGLQQVSLS